VLERPPVRVGQAVAGWARLLEATGRAFVEPFDAHRIGLALSGLFDGLLIRQQIDPDAVDDELFADVAATLATALTVPRGSRVRLADLAEPLHNHANLSPQARSGARRRRESRLRITDAATGLFAEGWEQVPASDIAEAAGVSNQTVLNLFGGVREVAASTFVRHMPDLRSLAAATSDEDPLVALHRVLSRLSELAEGDPEPARALLAERVAVKLRHGGDLQEMDIRLGCPSCNVLPAIERMDLGGRARQMRRPLRRPLTLTIDGSAAGRRRRLAMRCSARASGHRAVGAASRVRPTDRHGSTG
jgi:AcrR family transcriptional regulator